MINLKYDSDRWKKNYIQQLETDNKLKVKDFLLDTIYLDDCIYKYYRGLNRDFDTISSPAVWLCNAFYLNDPFDSYFLLKGKEESDRNITLWKQLQHDTKARNMQRTIFLASFSERSDSILMWSHYANNHKGVCIGYSLKELIEKYDFFPVVYEGRLQQYTDGSSELREILTKYTDWSYEKEWRLIQKDEKGKSLNGKCIPFVKPKEIILGCKSDDLIFRTSIPKEDVDEELVEAEPEYFIDYARYLGYYCYQYSMQPDSFALKLITRV